eukprot:3838231-Rhodomonas_salina.1
MLVSEPQLRLRLMKAAPAPGGAQALADSDSDSDSDQPECDGAPHTPHRGSHGSQPVTRPAGAARRLQLTPVTVPAHLAVHPLSSHWQLSSRARAPPACQLEPAVTLCDSEPRTLVTMTASRFKLADSQDSLGHSQSQH